MDWTNDIQIHCHCIRFVVGGLHFHFHEERER
jgi:hypothetical protein